VRRARLAGLVTASLGALVLLTAPLIAPNASATLQARSIKAALRAATPTKAPFPGLTTTVVHVGGRPRHVVIAKTESQRQLGLRRRSNLGLYDGMLFVFDGTTQVGFTMSTVPTALDIGFYASNGRVVDQLRMLPCARAEADCPVYQARGSFRYALETLPGDIPAGTLSG
jgi:uncharacterized membrane protein (UPF0127 family)